MFLRNCWYLAAWACELAPGDMLARTIAGEPLLLVRSTEGVAHALADTCPHRLVPLSRGQCQAGEVTCIYHGLRFAADGRCLENPHGPITQALTVRSFACVERHDALWLWLGDATPDESAIPDYGFIDAVPPSARVQGYLHSMADYRLMVDNIMDLTHADFLHASTLGGGINSRARVAVEQDGDDVTITWSAVDDQLPPLMRSAIASPEGKGDFRNRVLWQAPGNMRQQVTIAASHRIDHEPIDSTTCHVMTPETATTTHYFFCHTSESVTADPTLAPVVLEALTGAFAGEDKPMLEAQSDRIGGKDFWSFRPALLPSDKGAVIARRVLDRLLTAE